MMNHIYQKNVKFFPRCVRVQPIVNGHPWEKVNGPLKEAGCHLIEVKRTDWPPIGTLITACLIGMVINRWPLNGDLTVRNFHTL